MQIYFQKPILMLTALRVACLWCFILCAQVGVASNEPITGWCQFDPATGSSGYSDGFVTHSAAANKCVSACTGDITGTGNPTFRDCRLLGVSGHLTQQSGAFYTQYQYHNFEITFTETLPNGTESVQTIVGSYFTSGRRLCLNGDTNNGSCVICPAGQEWDSASGQCDANPQNDPQCPAAPGTNPVNILTGNKHQIETDISIPSASGYPNLHFQRRYSSSPGYGASTAFNGHWRHTYERSVDIRGLNSEIAYVSRSDGQRVEFVKSSGVWVDTAGSGSELEDMNDLTGGLVGWAYTSPNDEIETYNRLGFLSSIERKDGYTQTLTYDLDIPSGGDDDIYTLDRVVDSVGNELFFVFGVNGLESVTDQAGNSYTYSYDSNGFLSSIAYPDSTPTDNTDNPQRSYHYEDPNFPHALTGITDEEGNRFATWAYDSEGRAVSSEHAGGVEYVSLDYTYIDDVIDPRISTTNALGKSSTYHFEVINGIRKVTQIEGHASPNCVAANQNYTYDANGFKDLVTDWEGNVTDYDYDAEGREVSRTEALGTPEEKVILTEWHATYRLPTKMTYLDKIVDFVYDGDGNLLSRTESPNSL